MGGDEGAGLSREGSHLGEERVEASAVGDPFLVVVGRVVGEDPGDGPALFFPGELPVGAVAAFRLRAAAVRVAATGAPLQEGALAHEADFGEFRLRGGVVGLALLEAALELGGRKTSLGHRPLVPTSPLDVHEQQGEGRSRLVE